PGRRGQFGSLIEAVGRHLAFGVRWSEGQADGGKGIGNCRSHDASSSKLEHAVSPDAPPAQFPISNFFPAGAQNVALAALEARCRAGAEVVRLPAAGTSMVPTLRPGDILQIRPLGARGVAVG